MASKKILVNLDLQRNQLENAVVHNSSTEPNPKTKGQLWYDTGSNELKYYDGSNWVSPATTEGHLYALSGSGATVQLTQDGGTTGNAGSYTIPAASGSNAGTMSAADYTKLAGVAAGATANTGTVTSVATTGAITGGTITTSGTISHSTANGYKHIPSNGAANQYLKYSSAGTAAWQSPDTTPTASSNNLITSGAVASAISGLPTPMQFKGTLGTNGTYTSSTFPAAAAANTGWTVKVITDGTYQSVAAKVGDTLISDGSAWVLVPSGDEPSGTVTNIATSGAITGGPITTTGTISHSTSAGYKHIPSSGATNNYLKYGGSSGTAAWQAPDTAPTASSGNLITSGAVKTAIDGITHPEQISRATLTIAANATTGSVSIGTGKTVFAVTAIQSNAGVVADWSYASGNVTVTLAAAASSAVTVNVLYYGGGTIPSSVQSDYIVDSGSDSNWEWRKWASGNAECWGQFSHSFACTSQSGNGWFTSSATQETFPSGLFSENPRFCQITGFSSDGKALSFEMGGGLSTTKTQNFWAYRVESSATVSTYLQVYAKGRWQ